ncbi:DUF4238 domain-containing protein [Microlunatus flavus]|uniref:DUF4238 domain-containing protein n=1 Tax=Microlunatus flavus TaxID=1036181 RepID=UPI001481C783|nr:DUF4238 domain-containing protein [Microlunatus flavus]
MVDLLNPYASERGADRRAKEWLGNLDHQAAVGSRHHIVPRFLLERFASTDKRLRVRSRVDGTASVRSIGDLAVRDFYTSVTTDTGLDSSLESLLSIVEGRAAHILRQHLDYPAFSRARPFTLEERSALDLFVASQAIRGMRIRRGLEVVTDYTVKLLNHDKISEDDIQNTEFLPHSNDHLKMFGSLVERVAESLRKRSTSLLQLEKPLLIIGDEPVILESEKVGPIEGGRSEAKVEPEEFVNVEGGLGFGNADVVLLPVSSSAVLLYGPPNHQGLPTALELGGEEARLIAEEINWKVAYAAIDWVAANPSHPGFASMTMPPRPPVLKVRDYGSLAAERVNSTPAHRPIRRLRADDVS